MSNQGHELILIPRIENPKVVDSALKTDLADLTKAVNAQGGLKISLSLDKASIDGAKKQLSELADLQKQASTVKLSEFSGATVSTKAMTAERAEIVKKTLAIKDQEAAERQRAEVAINNSKIEMQSSKASEAAVKQRVATIRELEAADRQRAVAAINNAKTEIANSRLKVQLKKEEASMAKMAESQVKSELANERSINGVNQQVVVLQSRIDKAKVTWSQMFSDPTIVARLRDIELALNSVGGDRERYKAVARDFQVLSNNIAEAGLNTKTFGDRLHETATRLSAYLVNVIAYQAIISGVKNAVEAVKELDLSLTEIKKVSDLSGESLSIFVDRAFEAADAIGRTGKDLIDATAEFRRAGYDLESAFEMGQAALIMTNVGDGIESVEEAASALIATLRGFNISEANVMDVVNSINEVSNTAPIAFADLTEGLRRVSGTLSQTGTDINETIGLLTGGFAQLRDIEGVSAGLIMISQRLRGIGESGEEIDGLAPKLQQAFKEIADIDISDGNNGLRSTYDILSDLAEVYPTLTDEQQQYLGELTAGNRQVKVLNAILMGWTDVATAVSSANDSMGSAMLENEKYMDSIDGRMQKIQSRFQDVARTLIDSEVVKVIISIGDALLSLVAIGDGVPTILIAIASSIATVNAAAKSVSVTNFISNFKKFFTDIGRPNKQGFVKEHCRIHHSNRVFVLVG